MIKKLDIRSYIELCKYLLTNFRNKDHLSGVIKFIE